MNRSIDVLTEDIITDKNKTILQVSPPISPLIAEVIEPTKTIDNKKNEHVKYYDFTDYTMIKSGNILNHKYSVIRNLGSGAFSTVWLCRTKNLMSDNVAVKVFTKSTAARSVQKEISYLKLVKDNPRFVKLIDNFVACSENGFHECLVLQSLNATLLDLIRKSGYHGIPILCVKLIAKQILEGLDYLHNVCGLIHADIKPDNIHVSIKDGDVSVKIADLGCARSIESCNSGLIQAPFYRSPEVILSHGFGPTTDIWSLACVLFQLATGNCLFRAQASANYSRDEHHLALMIQFLGKMDTSFSLKTILGRIFFLPNGDLRCIDQMKPFGPFTRLTKQYKWQYDLAASFALFLRPMLKYNPELRVSASQCLRHKWLKF